MNIRSNRLRMGLLPSDGVPTLSEVGLLDLKDMAKLLDASFHLCGSALGHFQNEGSGAAQIEWNQRLQQMIAVEKSMMVGVRSFVDHANPKLIGNVESQAVAMDKFGEVGQDFGGQKRAVDFPQIVHALLSGVNHAVSVYRERLYANLKREPEQRDVFVGVGIFPDGFVTLHQTEKRADNLPEHAGQVRARIFRVMDFGAQIGLPNSKSFGDRGHGHPDVNPEASHISVPDVLLQVACGHLAGESELTANWLAYGFSVKRARHRVDDSVRDRAVIFVPVIIGSDVVVPVLEDRLRQKFHPLGSDAPQIGIDHNAHLRIQLTGHRKDGAERAAFPGNAVIRRADPLTGIHGMQHQQKVFGSRFHLHDHLLGVVFRSAIGVHDDRPAGWKILCQSHRYCAHYLADRSSVVVTGDADDDVRLAQLFEAGL